MHPPYINGNGNTSFSTINHQRMTSFGFYNHKIPNHVTTNMQPTMENSNYNNGKFLESDSGYRLNSHLIVENKCLTGKRYSKKDHHSKIYTARGPRDRRMRLSLDVAKKFFKLQDMLGFDKASNTVHWLLMKSQPAIRDLRPQHLSNPSCSLMGVSNTPSSASECQVLSENYDQLVITTNDEKTVDKKRFEIGVSTTAYIDHPPVKETREKARARARKRTIEKRNIKLGCDSAGSDQYLKFIQDVDQHQNTNFGEDQLTNHFGDNSSMISIDQSPSFLFSYQDNLRPCDEHQFNDFQILGTLWEDIND